MTRSPPIGTTVRRTSRALSQENRLGLDEDRVWRTVACNCRHCVAGTHVLATCYGLACQLHLPVSGIEIAVAGDEVRTW